MSDFPFIIIPIIIFGYILGWWILQVCAAVSPFFERNNKLDVKASNYGITSDYLDEIENRTLGKSDNSLDYTSLLAEAFESERSEFSFKTIQGLSRSWGVWKELEHGEAQLITEEQLEEYIHAYGRMHEAKLRKAFKKLFKSEDIDLISGAYEVIDYGCGQGIGSVVFIDFMKSYFKNSFTVRKVKLIEPSPLALERATLHVEYSLQSANQVAEVETLETKLDYSLEFELDFDDDTVKIHIFSNILDMEEIDIDCLCDILSETCKGINYFVCVSPNYSKTSFFERNFNLDCFMQHFEEEHQVEVISERQSNIGKWTRFERIFKVDFNPVFEEPVRPNSYNRVSSFQNDEPDELPF